MKIGVLGGTFNPVHAGHLILAEELREKLRLDKVIFIPTFIPPHKKTRDIAAAAQRLAMVRLAIRGNPCFSVSDVEIRRKGASYTIDTIRQLKKTFPRDELVFIIGSDLLQYLDEWKDIGEVTKLVKFVVATRPGFPLENLRTVSARYTNISTVPIRAVDISGFQVRECIRKGRSFRYLVPEAVHRYIVKNKVYGTL